MTDITREESTSDIVREYIHRYGHYVLEERALPDSRDGLKPSQRRVLWTFHHMGVTSRKTTVKSARVIGEIIGRWHPHGDQSAYDTLVRMSHARHATVHGDGNFGNFEAVIEKPAAAYRYTECRLAELGDRCFDDIHVAEMQPNYDDTDQEPVRLPVPIPFVLINGCEGIAMGLSTSIPPHNAGEIIDACLHMIDHPTATTEDLLTFIKGPDYGGGVLLSKKSDLLSLYETGVGKLAFQSQCTLEDTHRKGIKKLVINGLAPGVHKKKLYDTTVALTKKKLLDSPVMDETTLKSGYRETITYRDPQLLKERVLPLLDSSISYRWYCLGLDGRPRKFTLVELLTDFLDFRREIEEAVLQDRLGKLQHQLGIEVAKYRAAQDIDYVIRVLHESETEDEARSELMEHLRIEDWQADAILQAQIRTLIRSNAAKIKLTGQKLKKQVKEVKISLSDIDGVLRDRFEAMRKYATPRGTRLRGHTKNFGTDAKYWVGVTSAGKVDVSLDLPLGSKALWSYVDFVRTDGEVAIVHDTNQVSVVHVSYLDKYTPNGKVMSVSADPYCCVVTKSGRYVAFAIKQKRTQFPAIKDIGDDEIAFAFGFNLDDRIVFDLDCPLEWWTPDDLKITRPNVKSRKLKTSSTPLMAYILKPDFRIISDSGDELGKAEFCQDGIRILGKHNLLSLHSGKRSVVSYSDAVKAVCNEEANVVVPIER